MALPSARTGRVLTVDGQLQGDSLADGDSVQDLLHHFPTLTEPDILAVIAYAAASALEDLGIVPMPSANAPLEVAHGE